MAWLLKEEGLYREIWGCMPGGLGLRAQRIGFRKCPSTSVTRGSVRPKGIYIYICIYTCI